MFRSLAALSVVTSLLLSGCSSESPDTEHERTRIKALRVFGDDYSGVTHVADFNNRRGPGSETVEVPADASGLVVRFDCVGPRQKFILEIPVLSKGGSTCDALAGFGWSAGSFDVSGKPAVKKGQMVTANIEVGADVNWSISFDLAYSEESFESMLGDS